MSLSWFWFWAAKLCPCIAVLHWPYRWQKHPCKTWQQSVGIWAMLTVQANGTVPFVVRLQKYCRTARNSNKANCSIYFIRKQALHTAGSSLQLAPANASSCSMIASQETSWRTRGRIMPEKQLAMLQGIYEQSFKQLLLLHTDSPSIWTGGVSMTDNSQEHWLWGIVQICRRSQDGFYFDFNHYVMPKDAFLELGRHCQDVLAIPLYQLARRNSSPCCHNVGNIFRKSTSQS